MAVDAVEEVEEELNEFGFTEAEMLGDEEEVEDDEDEDASPIEEFVEEEVVVDDSELEMNWYILKVQVNREKFDLRSLGAESKASGF